MGSSGLCLILVGILTSTYYKLNNTIEVNRMIWIEDYISTFAVNKYHYIFYEYLSSDSLFFEERRAQMIPKDYEERRKATMLEF